MKHMLLSFGFILLAGALAFQAAPYLPRLMMEGFPTALWPAPGAFATLIGTDRDRSPKRGPPLAVDSGLRRLFDKSGGTALLVSHKGRLLLEHYAPGYGPATRFNSYSLVKSLIGALMLKAVAEGKIRSLDEPVGSYVDGLNSSLERVGLNRLLNMTSGIAHEPGTAKSVSGLQEKDMEASFANPFGPLVRLHMLGLAAIAPGLKRTAGPAPRFSYQNINTAVLGAVLAQVYGQPLDRLLADKIWRPAGAANAFWRRYDEQLPVSAYCCLYATTRDWLKVAYFLMTNGHPDKPFLPPELQRRLMGHDLTPEAAHRGVYRGHWRYDILDRPGAALQGKFAYFLGRGGQAVYIKPGEQLAVVRFGSSAQLLHSTLYETWREIAPYMPDTTNAAP
jgi:CubicO group peptidase (beta-lactamase class C family)